MSKQATQLESPAEVTAPAAAGQVAPAPVIAPQMTHTPELIEKIRTRAYELYLERGCREGHGEQDWLDAEAEIIAAQNILAA